MSSIGMAEAQLTQVSEADKHAEESKRVAVIKEKHKAQKEDRHKKER